MRGRPATGRHVDRAGVVRSGGRRRGALAGLLIPALLVGAGCSGADAPDGERPTAAPNRGDVDTSQFEGLLTECQIVPETQIAKAVGGGYAEPDFNGAICRWVVTSPGVTDVTLAWYEWGDFNLEKRTAQRLGFETENIQVNSVAAFTMRDPARPAVCGVTAKSPGRGTLTWWAEPKSAPPGDPCAGPIALMEMVISRAA